MHASDADLVKRALAGDRAAFGPLVERHRSILLRLAQRMLGDPAEAEDVAQEACLHAFLSLSRLRDPERFGAWSSIEGMHAWVSVPAPELNLPTKPC